MSKKIQCNKVIKGYGGQIRQCELPALKGSEFCHAHDEANQKKRKAKLASPLFWAKKAAKLRKELTRLAALSDPGVEQVRAKYLEALETCMECVLSQEHSTLH
jgi:hypothetical protein